MTAAFVPFTAAWSAASVVTTWGVALPPPVVVETPLPASAAQPTSGLGAGGVVHDPPDDEDDALPLDDDELAPEDEEELPEDEDDELPLDDEELPLDDERAPDDEEELPEEEDELPLEDDEVLPEDEDDAPEDDEVLPDDDDDDGELPEDEDDAPEDDDEGWESGVQLRVVTGEPPVHWAGSALVTLRVWLPSAWHAPQSE